MKIERMQYHDSYYQHPGVRKKTKKRLAESDYAVDPEAKKDDQPGQQQQADGQDESTTDSRVISEELITSKAKIAEGSLDIVV